MPRRCPSSVHFSTVSGALQRGRHPGIRIGTALPADRSADNGLDVTGHGSVLRSGVVASTRPITAIRGSLGGIKSPSLAARCAGIGSENHATIVKTTALLAPFMSSSVQPGPPHHLRSTRVPGKRQTSGDIVQREVRNALMTAGASNAGRHPSYLAGFSAVGEGDIQAAISVMTFSATWPGVSYSCGVEGPAPATNRWFRSG